MSLFRRGQKRSLFPRLFSGKCVGRGRGVVLWGCRGRSAMSKCQTESVAANMPPIVRRGSPSPRTPLPPATLAPAAGNYPHIAPRHRFIKLFRKRRNIINWRFSFERRSAGRRARGTLPARQYLLLSLFRTVKLLTVSISQRCRGGATVS